MAQEGGSQELGSKTTPAEVRQMLGLGGAEHKRFYQELQVGALIASIIKSR